jgi:sirohydrochlorin cobaltochelatase
MNPAYPDVPTAQRFGRCWYLEGMHDDSLPPLGWLVVGHGTRDVAGQAEFREVVRQLAERSTVPVASGFLELAEPTIAQGLGELADRGVRRVLVVPLLLFTAGHAKEDVPVEVAQSAAALGIQVVGQSAALELHPQLLELSRLRFREAIGSLEGTADTRLLIVGRGGSDAAALEAMRTYTAELAASLGVLGQTAFAALARPTVEEAVIEIAAVGSVRVVVQPHLLFRGEVLASIDQQVAAARLVHPNIQWLLASHLGPDPLLIEAILSRIEETATKNPGRSGGLVARSGQ